MPVLDADAQRWFDEFTCNVQRLGEAVACIEIVAAIDAAVLSVDARCCLSQRLLRAGFAASAVALLDAAMVRFPNTLELHYWRGNALRTVGWDARAESDLRAVLLRNPGHRNAAWSLAHLLREQGRMNATAQVVASLSKNTQYTDEDALAAIVFLIECGEHMTAQSIAREARQRWPMDARIAARSGEIALALGAFDEGAVVLRAALDLDPRQCAAGLRLAYCRRFEHLADADLDRFAHAWVDPSLDADSQICAGFALGKALDDLGDHAGAARVLRVANQRAHSASNWRGEDWRRFVESRLHNRPPLPAQSADPDFVPVFVVGLPRTGTTLIAKTLAEHASVHNGGELHWIPELYGYLRKQRKLHDTRALESAARLIRVQMRRDDAPARFYIDKNPLNFRYLDFIVALFPNAKIVDCRRAPRDTALSLWMQHFAHADMSFAYDFAGISKMEKGYRSLMAHWRRTLALDIIDVDYENFVADPQAQQSRLAQFLDWPALELSRTVAGLTPDVVTTASVWQVRQPVYRHAIGRWRAYAPYLPELTDLFTE